MALDFPFELDDFQRVSIACLERKESILVAAHTSAGKTTIAEYAIALSKRENLRVIYTSPIKALSNQKYRDFKLRFKELEVEVGLITGDVKTDPNSSCLVVTTEILHSMISTDSLMSDVGWVIFDEIHYMEHQERGIVWEESIILLPPSIKMVFLSATMSNAREFADWVCMLHKKPCHVVFTDFRPTPLEHYVFASGGSGFHLIADQDGRFNEENLMSAQSIFTKRENNLEKREAADSDIQTVVKAIKEHHLLPVIFFSFSRKECENHAESLELDYNTEEDKTDIGRIVQAATDT
ncbi:hypothetical protein PR202_ga13792 [Eleusine coracana subsp. coracana]|uniref:Helicase ATP-binding domain-containing protein n=1 Tax=Eleusine coracana subsp. coracana TaxID=191504 RepID=A0AAV5CFS2_ELECO|nr:hypothetical protein PR202_ga13792 [Eleusine coracana subsp. coracana]